MYRNQANDAPLGLLVSIRCCAPTQPPTLHYLTREPGAESSFSIDQSPRIKAADSFPPQNRHFPVNEDAKTADR